VRVTLIVLEAFIALTATITGMAVLINGPDVIQMPLVEWLRNTPFSDYTIPMPILLAATYHDARDRTHRGAAHFSHPAELPLYCPVVILGMVQMNVTVLG